MSAVDSNHAVIGRLALLFTAVGLASTPAISAENHSYVCTYDNKKVWDNEFIQHVQDTLKDTATYTHIVTTVCYSSGFVKEAGLRMTGNWSCAASRSNRYPVDEDTKGLGVEWTAYSNQKTKKHPKTGKKVEGWQITADPDIKNKWAYAWGCQILQQFEIDKTLSAQKIFDLAKANDIDTGTPSFDSGGTGKDAAYIGGAKKRVAHWQTTCSRNDVPITARKLYKTVGYDDAREIDFAYNDGDNDVPGLKVDRAATRDELIGNTGMIAKIKTDLAGGDGDKYALIYLWAHGNRDTREVPKVPNPLDGERKQGRLITPNDSTVPVSIDDTFAEAFFADLGDDPLLSRVGQPTIEFTTSEETYAGPLLVTVAGVQIGIVPITGSSQGSDYSIDVTDSAWQALQDSHALDGASVTVEFLFPPSATGGIRFATEWDASLDNLAHWGVGLAGPPIRGEFDACPADFDHSRFIDLEDFDAFIAAFEAGEDPADIDGSGFVDVEDFSAFVQAFEQGC